MAFRIRQLLTFSLLITGFLAMNASATVRYVDVNSTNGTPPYTNWATAATKIQEAVDAAVAGDEIVVTNGIYVTGGRSEDGFTTNRVAVDKPLNLRSVNGPQSTTIDGGGVFRCVYLTNGASLSGFTLTNGRSHSGGGVWCESTNAVVSNCVVSGNSSFAQIIFQCCVEPAFAGGVNGGTLNNCILSNNSAETYSYFGRRCSHCYFVSGPSSWHDFLGVGGGVGNATLNSCTLTRNSAGDGGGAIGCNLNNCTLAGNSANTGGGAYDCTLNNCTLTGNRADAFYRSDDEGRIFRIGGYGGGAIAGTLNNCIVYFNTAPDGANYLYGALNYSGTTPLPTNGVGNITNAPLFVNPAAGNYRLRPNSPCIDAGTNLSASITNDLDGRPRPLDGNGDGLAAFDMGAYEYRTPLLVWQDSPNPTPPHADWATATHTIQDAVDAAVAGDEIVVTNGNYATGGRAVDGYTTNRVAVDKPLMLRSVNGPQFTTIDGGHSNRCVYLTNGASLSGFTLTNGGLVVRGATFGGGAYGGTLNNCMLSGNSAAYGGGASGCTLNNCTLTGNSANGFHVPLGSGGFNGYGGGAYECSLNNCTLIGNTAYPKDLSTGCCGLGGGAYGGTLNNCIVYFNTNYGGNHSACTLNYSCTTPLLANGVGNITNAPLFVDYAGGNLRLQSNSPCINAGRNSFAPAGPDLDGNPRIKGDTVDIGAYEFQSPTSIISYAWLQQFNLPTDGSADTTDPDGDRLNNWQEWRCATDPNNAVSTLRMLAPAVVGSDLLVRWESVADRTYFLERSTDASSAFTPLATDIPGQPGTTTYTHTNGAGAGPSFYRVGVEE